jgi:hypothetical protein
MVPGHFFNPSRLLTFSPGLFVGAIGESVFWPREAPVSELEFQFDLFASAAGCVNVTDQIACLRAQNTSTLVAANVAHPFQGRASNPDFFYTPTIDGDFVQDHLYTLFREGKFIRVCSIALLEGTRSISLRCPQ